MFQVKDIPIHPDYYKYPSSDGEPMAETTKHFRWIVTIKENLDILTKGKDIFVAGDLLWYPVQGQTNVCKAPDVMVAIGRPKGDRLSYLQWLENGIAPQVVFEIFSKSNRRRMNKENLLEFYQKFGVQEYYSYDPDSNTFVVYLLRGGDDVTQLEGLQRWTSPLLQIRFEWSEAGLEIYHPDNTPFVSFEELETQNRYLVSQYEEVQKLRLLEQKRFMEVKKEANSARREAEFALQEAEFAKQEATNAKQEASDAKQEASDAKQEASDAKNRQKFLEDKLRALGIDPNATDA